MLGKYAEQVGVNTLLYFQRFREREKKLSRVTWLDLFVPFHISPYYEAYITIKFDGIEDIETAGWRGFCVARTHVGGYMAKSIDLPNGRSWGTQKAALAHFKEMLGRYGDNAVVENRADHDELVALLERYDGVITDGPPKIGNGVDAFIRKRNAGEGYSTPGFWVRRLDGSETDFSYIAAVKGEPKSNATEFYDACRAAVARDLVAAKKRHFQKHADPAGRVACELSGDLITIDEAHLDHAYPTFGTLVVTFRAARGWQHLVPPGTVSAPADGQTTSVFIEAAVAGSFRAFHHQAALLRIVSARRNMAMAAGQRRPKVRFPVSV